MTCRCGLISAVSGFDGMGAGMGAATFETARGLADQGVEVHVFHTADRVTREPGGTIIQHGFKHRLPNWLDVWGRINLRLPHASRRGWDAAMFTHRRNARDIAKALRRAERSLDFSFFEFTENHFAAIPYLRDKARKTKVIVKCHGTSAHFGAIGLTIETEGDRFPQDMIRFQTGNADRVLVPSQSMLDECSLWLPVDDRWHVVPNAIDVAFWQPPEDNGCEKTDKVILCTARQEWLKGADIVYRAMEKVWEKHPDVTLCLPFGAPLDPMVIEAWHHMLAACPGASRLRVMDYVPRFDLRRLYRESLFAVNPSRWDSFCYAALEAVASGIPLISSPKGSIPEMVANGVNGYLIDEDDLDAWIDAILRYLEDPALARAHGRNGTRFAMTFDRSRVAARYRELLASWGWW